MLLPCLRSGGHGRTLRLCSFGRLTVESTVHRRVTNFAHEDDFPTLNIRFILTKKILMSESMRVRECLLVLYTAVDTDFPTHPPPSCLLVQKAKNLGWDLRGPERFPGVSVPFCSACPIRRCKHKPLSARLPSASGYFTGVDIVNITF